MLVVLPSDAMVSATMSRTTSSAPDSSRSVHVVFSLLLFLFFAELHHATLCFAADTISVNQSLSGNQTITSSNGNFVLGFFRPGNSSNYYVAIWYSFSTSISIWVANRENPISDPNTSELKISEDGNLVLLDSSRSNIWSTDANVSSSSCVAVLLDDGNLQLRDESNSSNLFWQSFDHPGDTWLPGAKLGFNKVTNRSQRLTSWKNSADPSPGIFNFELDPNGTSQFYLIWNRSTKYWTTGTWVEESQIFSNIPELAWNRIYDVEFVSNEKEVYLKYSARNSSLNLTRFVMTTLGRFSETGWVDSQLWSAPWMEPGKQCVVYSICGPFGSCNEDAQQCNCLKGFDKYNSTEWDLGDPTGGCKRNAALQCQSNSAHKVKRDQFFQMPNTRLPVNSQNIAAGSNGDCEATCLDNCNCTAYAYNSTGCFVWYGELLNVQEKYTGSDAATLYLRLAASEFPPPAKSDKGKLIAIIVAVIVAVVACSALFWVLLRRRINKLRRSTAKIAQGTVTGFRYFELQLATKNFSEKLGGSGFGSVFKGTLPDSTDIAVKRLQGVHQGEKQFRTEVSTIGTIRHVNLVRLLGFCSEGTKRLLVFEYMPKGSLDNELFEGSATALDWNTRYQIAIGTARGLAYLHEECRDRIIHCDIKPPNILLDACFIPKVADFGLAKLLGRDFSRALTTMRGTRGYLAPEWITGTPISAKADIYSYGMMLLEIISGRRNAERGEDDGAEFFPSMAARKLVEGEVLSLLDSRLNGDANLMELEKACRVACWCIQDDEELRPTMVQIVQVLEGLLEVNVPPVPRSLQAFTHGSEKINFFSDLSSDQNSQ